MFLIPGDTVLSPYRFGIAHATDRVVPSGGICGDATEDPPHIGIASMSLGQSKRVLRLQGVRHVVALQLFFLIVEEHRGIGSAFHIREAQRSASTHNAGPMAASGDAFFPYMCVLLLHDLSSPRQNDSFNSGGCC